MKKQGTGTNGDKKISSRADQTSESAEEIKSASALPDECGDSLWQPVLEQENKKRNSDENSSHTSDVQNSSQKK